MNHLKYISQSSHFAGLSMNENCILFNLIFGLFAQTILSESAQQLRNFSANLAENKYTVWHNIMEVMEILMHIQKSLYAYQYAMSWNKGKAVKRNC
ncbi:hypothetical protein ACJX0J_022078, partial [Zea mays]